MYAMMNSQSHNFSSSCEKLHSGLDSGATWKGPTYRVAFRAIVPRRPLGAGRSGRAGGPRFPFLSSFSFGALHRRRAVT